VLKKEMISTGSKMDEIQETIFRIRKKTGIRTKDRKAVEILKERQKSEWLKEIQDSGTGL
jgi:hypothetical protein